MWRELVLCLVAADSVVWSGGGGACAACPAPAAASVTHVSAVEGQPAALPCGVDARGAMTGWSRRVAGWCHLVAITVNSFVHVQSGRYSVDGWPHVQLVIGRARVADAGLYRCHAEYETGRSAPATRWLQLTVTAPDRTVITGGSSGRVREGDPITLTCASQRPMWWTFNGGDSWAEVGQSPLRSRLYIAAARPTDTGVYACHADGLTSSHAEIFVVPKFNKSTEVTSAANSVRVLRLPIIVLCVFKYILY